MPSYADELRAEARDLYRRGKITATEYNDALRAIQARRGTAEIAFLRRQVAC